MMDSRVIKPHQKVFFMKNYEHLWQIEKAIQIIQKNSKEQLQLSVLGKLAGDCISSHTNPINAKNNLKEYWKRSLGTDSDFDFFCNPKIGTLFIAGSLVPQFLKDMGGKALGELSSGPIGILRGLGISKRNSSFYLNALNDRHFLLMLRGYDYDLGRLKTLLHS